MSILPYLREEAGTLRVLRASIASVVMKLAPGWVLDNDGKEETLGRVPSLISDSTSTSSQDDQGNVLVFPKQSHYPEPVETMDQGSFLHRVNQKHPHVPPIDITNAPRALNFSSSSTLSETSPEGSGTERHKSCKTSRQLPVSSPRKPHPYTRPRSSLTTKSSSNDQRDNTFINTTSPVDTRRKLRKIRSAIGGNVKDSDLPSLTGLLQMPRSLLIPAHVSLSKAKKDDKEKFDISPKDDGYRSETAGSAKTHAKKPRKSRSRSSSLPTLKLPIVTLKEEKQSAKELKSSLRIGADVNAKLGVVELNSKPTQRMEVHFEAESSSKAIEHGQDGAARSPRFMIPSPSVADSPTSALLEYYDGPELVRAPVRNVRTGTGTTKTTGVTNDTKVAFETTPAGGPQRRMLTYQSHVRGRESPFPVKSVLSPWKSKHARSISLSRLMENPVLAKHPDFMVPKRYDSVGFALSGTS